MRQLVPLVLVAALAGCAPAPPPVAAPFTAQQQAQVDRLLGDKVAGTPQSRLPHWRTHNMAAISDTMLVFRESPGRAWVQTPQNPCNQVSMGPYALVTQNSTGMLCRGDIAQVVDTMSGANVGSCVMGDFVPYTRPGA